MKREQALLTIDAALESFEKGTWTIPEMTKTILNTLKYLVENQASTTMEVDMAGNQWTMNCVLFGASLFKQLYQGKIKKEDAIEAIRNLSSSLGIEETAYLLKRLQDLVTG